MQDNMPVSFKTSQHSENIDSHKMKVSKYKQQKIIQNWSLKQKNEPKTSLTSTKKGAHC